MACACNPRTGVQKQVDPCHALVIQTSWISEPQANVRPSLKSPGGPLLMKDIWAWPLASTCTWTHAHTHTETSTHTRTHTGKDKTPKLMFSSIILLLWCRTPVGYLFACAAALRTKMTGMLYFTCYSGHHCLGPASRYMLVISVLGRRLEEGGPWVQGQSQLHRETLFRGKKAKKTSMVVHASNSRLGRWRREDCRFEQLRL